MLEVYNTIADEYPSYILDHLHVIPYTEKRNKIVSNGAFNGHYI